MRRESTRRQQKRGDVNVVRVRTQEVARDLADVDEHARVRVVDVLPEIAG